jgi:hypothetical protein
VTVHEKVESELAKHFPSSWIIGDDGTGEIADHIVVEPIDGDHLELHLFERSWTHAAAGLVEAADDERSLCGCAAGFGRRSACQGI